MNVRTVERLPSGPTGSGEIHLAYRKLNVAVRFEYYKQGAYVQGEVELERVVAFRFHTSMHAHAVVHESSEAVVEIVDSEWLSGMRAATPRGVHGLEDAHHFSVLFTNSGYVEALAQRVRVTPELPAPAGHP